MLVPSPNCSSPECGGDGGGIGGIMASVGRRAAAAACSQGEGGGRAALDRELQLLQQQQQQHCSSSIQVLKAKLLCSVQLSSLPPLLTRKEEGLVVWGWTKTLGSPSADYRPPHSAGRRIPAPRVLRSHQDSVHFRPIPTITGCSSPTLRASITTRTRLTGLIW